MKRHFQRKDLAQLAKVEPENLRDENGALPIATTIEVYKDPHSTTTLDDQFVKEHLDEWLR